MKKAFQYIACVIFSLLLAFSLMATGALIAVDRIALNEEACVALIDAQALPEKARQSLEKHFDEQQNTTGVPATLFTESIAVDKLRVLMEDTIRNGFAYLNGETETIGISADFYALEADLRLFYSSYADMYGYAKDEAYEAAVEEAIQISEESICTSVDIFRFKSLADAGMMQKVRAVMPWISRGVLCCAVLDVVLLLILVLLNRKNLRRTWYWLACALCSAGVILYVPTAWLKSAEWFDRFTVKAPQTFAAVTAHLYHTTDAVKTYAVVCIVTAAVLWVICAVCGMMRKRKLRLTAASSEN